MNDKLAVSTISITTIDRKAQGGGQALASSVSEVIPALLQGGGNSVQQQGNRLDNATIRDF